jgi:hypothetical protein
LRANRVGQRDGLLASGRDVEIDYVWPSVRIRVDDRLSDPAPLSAVVVTVKVAASDPKSRFKTARQNARESAFWYISGRGFCFSAKPADDSKISRIRQV